MITTNQASLKDFSDSLFWLCKQPNISFLETFLKHQHEEYMHLKRYDNLTVIQDEKTKDSLFHTVLHHNLGCGYEFCELLIKEDFCVFLKNERGETPLHFLLKENIQNAKLINLFLDRYMLEKDFNRSFLMDEFAEDLLISHKGGNKLGCKLVLKAIQKLN